MKKELKIYLLGFLSCLLLSSIVVYAALYNANDVEFTPNSSSWEVSNVNEALNDLSHRMVNNDIIGVSAVTHSSRMKGVTSSVILNKGKYIVTSISNLSQTGTSPNGSEDDEINVNNFDITAVNGTCKKINSRYAYTENTKKFNSYYLRVISLVITFECDITEDNTTVSAINNKYEAVDTQPLNVIINAVKIM